MKGLIIKDLMCLRKRRITYIYIVVVVLVVSIMFVLSARFGNIALAQRSMMTENGATDIDVKNLSAFVLSLFMMLPLAMVGDVTAIFWADGKAGFQNVSAIMPVSIEKRVLSKYITISMFFGIGVTTDLLLAFVISMLTDILTFGTILKIIITMASALFIYGAFICLYMFVFGYGKESFAQFSSIMTIIVALVLFNFSKVKRVFIYSFSDKTEVIDVNPIELIMEAIKDHYLMVLISAIVTGVLSYVLSVFIAKRKRGLV